MSITGALQGAFLKLHQGLYERSNGRIGKNLGSAPCLLLYTIGARTGATRCSCTALGDLVARPNYFGAE